MYTNMLVSMIEFKIAPFCMFNIPSSDGVPASALTVVPHSHIIGSMPKITHGYYFLSKFSNVCNKISNPTTNKHVNMTSLGMTETIIGKMLNMHNKNTVTPLYSD